MRKGTMSKVVIPGLLALLLVAAMAAACSQPAPSAPPTGAAKPHEEVNLEILGSPQGGTGYALGFALAEVVNKNHPWLRAAARESEFSVSIQTFVKEPERRKNTIAFFHEYGVHQAVVGDLKGTPAYNGIKAVAKFETGCMFFVTLNDKINTPNDFVGKKIGLGLPASTLYILPVAILKAYGILEKVNIEPMTGWTPLGAVGDGKIDVAMAYGGAAAPYPPLPGLSQLIASKPGLRFVGVSKESVAKAKDQGGYPFNYIELPAKAYSATQTNVVGTWGMSSGFWADAEMDAGTVYELTKTIYDNVAKFGDYHVVGKSMSKDSIAAIPIPESGFHPGAVKFFKEKGIKVGTG